MFSFAKSTSLSENPLPPELFSQSLQNNLSKLQKTFNRLSNPNWDATATYNTSTETGLKAWNDLLGSSKNTSQQIVDHYFSGSFCSGIQETNMCFGGATTC